MIRDIKIFKNIIKILKYSNVNNSTVGRWNILDNQEIKATMANMDCCGDSLCGKPTNYTIQINSILKETTYKN